MVKKSVFNPANLTGSKLTATASCGANCNWVGLRQKMFARSRVEILPQSPPRHWRKRFRMTSKQNQMPKHPCGLEAIRIKMKTDFGNGQTAVPGTLKLRQIPWKKRPQGTVSNSSEMELTIGELMIALKRTISCAAKSTVLVLILVSIKSLMLWMNLCAL